MKDPLILAELILFIGGWVLFGLFTKWDQAGRGLESFNFLPWQPYVLWAIGFGLMGIEWALFERKKEAPNF